MSSDARRRAIRYAAAVLSAGAAVVYVLIGFEVISVVDTKAPDMTSMLPFGLVSGSAFLLGAVLLTLFDRRILWILGGLFQVFAIAMYVAVAPQRDPSYEPWGIGLKAVQAILLIALMYLAVIRPRAAVHPTVRLMGQ
jgi:hypothetical protein